MKTVCRVPTHAIEVDWSRKWAEGIGQCLFYAEMTGRKPGLLLLIKDPAREWRYLWRAALVCGKHGITFYLEMAD